MSSIVTLILSMLLTVCGCGAQDPATPPPPTPEPIQTGWITAQVLEGEDGPIHYSYYLPENYDPDKEYPLMAAMPGYGDMWFGEDTEGNNLRWNGATVWTELDEDIIVVSAQLTDWHAKSARQAVELTEYMIENFAVDESRVYAAGYSAGGETMSQAVALRPDLYAAYIHGASQWDGEYEPLAKEGVAVYIFMGENDEYYDSQKARTAYENLRAAYEQAGYSETEINALLRLEIPDDAYFNAMGIYNYHGGGSVLFGREDIQDWILKQPKTEKEN